MFSATLRINCFILGSRKQELAERLCSYYSSEDDFQTFNCVYKNTIFHFGIGLIDDSNPIPTKPFLLLLCVSDIDEIDELERLIEASSDSGNYLIIRSKDSYFKDEHRSEKFIDVDFTNNNSTEDDEETVKENIEKCNFKDNFLTELRNAAFPENLEAERKTVKSFGLLFKEMQDRKSDANDQESKELQRLYAASISASK